MTHLNRGGLPALLETLKSEINTAGTRRDGCAVAHLTPVLSTLGTLGRGMNLSSPRAKHIGAVLWLARRKMPFCEIHDRAARGEIDRGPAYATALEAARVADAAFAAKMAA